MRKLEIAGRLAEAATDVIPVDPDDGTTIVTWDGGTPVWGVPDTLARAVVVAVLRELYEWDKDLPFHAPLRLLDLADRIEAGQ